MKKRIFSDLFFACLFLGFFQISEVKAQTKGYLKMGKYNNIKQLNGHWSAPNNVKLLGNGKEILLKALHFSIDDFSIAVEADFQEIENNKPNNKNQSEQVYNISLVNDVLILLMNKEGNESVSTPYIFVVKKIDAQSITLSTEREDFVFKKMKM